MPGISPWKRIAAAASVPLLIAMHAGIGITAMGALAPKASAGSAVVGCAENLRYASSVVTVNRGTMYDGSQSFPADRGTPQDVLGAPAGSAVAPLSGFFSLGYGGSITVQLPGRIINGAGADVRIFEASPTTAPLERALVYASRDGSAWTLIGMADNTANTGTVANATDLDLGALDSAIQIRLVDNTPGNPGSTEGFDLSGVQALHCVDLSTPQCRDYLDNDGDGAIDHPSDFSCSGPDDNDETNPKAQCQDGIDNADSEDTLADAQDPGCHTDGNASNAASYNAQDNDEGNAASSASSAVSSAASSVSSTASSVSSAVPQCRDNVDNDNDGATDFPSDFSCSDANDNDETLPRAACQDGIDNGDAEDALIDAQDPGCHADGNAANAATYNAQDNDEGNAVSSASSTSSIASSSAISSAASSSSSLTTGCIEVRTETFNPQNSPVTPVAQFTASLDGVRTAVNDSLGIARFENVAPGAHVVTQELPATWARDSIAPAGGAVTVNAGTACATVLIRNKQVLPIPTFTVTKSDGRTTAKRGDILTYTITVTNTSQYPATGVTVADTLPVDLEFLSASDGPQVSGQTVTWTNASVAPGTSRTLSVQARVRQNAAVGSVMRNSAQVSGPASAGGEDVTIIEGDAEQCAELEIDTEEDDATPGEELTYVITLTNDGDEDRTETVRLTLPDGVEFQDANEDGEEDDGIVEWEVDIDADDEIELKATVEVDGDEVEEGDELEAVAITDCATEEITTDVGEGDGEEEEDLSVSKDASPSEVFPGGTVEYTVTVENNGDTTLKDLEVEDHLTGSSFSIIDDGGADSVSGNTLKWTIDELKAGKTKVIRYRILVDATAYPGATVSNAVRVENDDVEGNASAYVTVIGSLPQTGVGMGRGKSTAHLSPFTAGGEGGSPMATAAWLMGILGTGTGIGVTVLRRKALGF